MDRMDVLSNDCSHLNILPVLDPSSKPILCTRYPFRMPIHPFGFWNLVNYAYYFLDFQNYQRFLVVPSGSRTWLLACFLDPLLLAYCRI